MKKLQLFAPFSLLIVSIVCIFLVGEKTLDTIHSVWKFGAAKGAIDWGAHSTVIYLGMASTFSALTGALTTTRFSTDNVVAKVALRSAAIIFAANGLVVLLLFTTGFAVAYCGR